MKKPAKKAMPMDPDKKMEGMEKKKGKESKKEEKAEKHDPMMHGYHKMEY